MAAAASDAGEGGDGAGDAARRLRTDHAALERLQEVTAALLGSQFDMARLVQSVTDAATELCGAEFGAFFYNVIGDTGESYTLYTLSGAPREAFERFGLPRNTPIFDPTFRGLGTVRIHDVTADPRYGHMAPHHGMPPGHLPVCSYLAVPVTAGDGGVLGGLFFGHSRPGVFTELHELVVSTIAGHAAVAIENARLYERQRSAAATLQHGLLPEDLPVVAGVSLAAAYRPAADENEVGGDWYDAMALPDGRLAVCVGDVCGHDLRAAATMGQLSAAMRAYVIEAPDPTAVVGRLDRFCSMAGVGAFTTLVYALFDPAERTLVVTRAGHPPPVLIDPSGEARLLEVAATPPVGCGLVDSGRLAEATATFTLPPGATVLLYTDGLVERRGRPIRDGIAELLDVVAHAPVRNVEELTRHVIHLLGEEGRDDVVLLALKAAA
jgi:hypothetical protein